MSFVKFALSIPLVIFSCVGNNLLWCQRSFVYEEYAVKVVVTTETEGQEEYSVFYDKLPRSTIFIDKDITSLTFQILDAVEDSRILEVQELTGWTVVILDQSRVFFISSNELFDVYLTESGNLYFLFRFKSLDKAYSVKRMEAFRSAFRLNQLPGPDLIKH